MALKVSVIGVGHLGAIHAKLWKQLDNIEFVGIYDANEERAKKVAEEQNCKYFTSLDEIIQASDAITISASTTSHYEIAKKCLEQNKHCFIEKPITSTYKEAQELIALAKEKKALIQVGHVERFNPAIAALKSYSLNPLFIEAHRLSQFKPRATDVSVIHDLMIHDVDIVLSLVKSPVTSIDASGVAVLTDTIDIANARLKFENGAVVNLTASRISQQNMRKMRMFQNKAYISIDFGKGETQVFKIQDENEPKHDVDIAYMLGAIDTGTKNVSIIFEQPKVPEINAIDEEHRAFVRSIELNEPIAVSAEDAAEALRIVDLISEQIEGRK